MSGQFQTGSALHFICLGVCALCVAGLIFAVGRSPSEEKAARIKRFIGFGSLGVWVLNTAFWLAPEHRGWDRSIPIHFCTLANLIGALAIFSKGRLFKSVLYFWAATLCIWAFLTPVVGGGIGNISFWIFWIYHLFILLAVTEVLFVQGFRPRFEDLKRAIIFTASFTMALAVLDYFTGWNYGFVGPAKPNVPTLLDVLGPYPWRLIWMAGLGVVLFTMAWLPWGILGRKSS